MRASPTRLVPANSSPPYTINPTPSRESPMPRIPASLGRSSPIANPRSIPHTEAEHGEEVLATQATPRFEEGHEQEQETTGQGEARCGEEDRRDALDDDLYRREGGSEEEDRQQQRGLDSYRGPPFRFLFSGQREPSVNGRSSSPRSGSLYRRRSHGRSSRRLLLQRSR